VGSLFSGREDAEPDDKKSFLSRMLRKAHEKMPPGQKFVLARTGFFFVSVDLAPDL